MDDREFRQVFDQVRLSSEEEDAMLERLLSGKRRTNPMKPVKKTVAVLAAAALLLMACAFTVATGLDQRFLAYFRGTEEDAQQMSGGVVGVGQSFQYENGWTIHIEQVLADRYSLAVLTEVVAPEGTVLDGEAYYFELGMELPPSARSQAVSSGWGYGPVILEDGNPKDNRLTFLQTKGARELGAKDLLGQSVTLTPMWLLESGGKKLDVDFSMEGQEKSCTVALSEQDGGRTYTLRAPIQVDGETMTLSELYLSPISAAFVLQGEPGEERTLEESDLTRIEEDAVLHLADGSEVPIRRMVSQTVDGETGAVHSVFQTDTILKPEDVVSITLLGQTVSLEGLTFTES